MGGQGGSQLLGHYIFPASAGCVEGRLAGSHIVSADSSWYRARPQGLLFKCQLPNDSEASPVPGWQKDIEAGVGRSLPSWDIAAGTGAASPGGGPELV